jgi:hypothetical protein
MLQTIIIFFIFNIFFNGDEHLHELYNYNYNNNKKEWNINHIRVLNISD